MALSIVTSTLQALRSLPANLSQVTPLSEAPMTDTWSDRWKKTFRMVLISAAVGGIELCYSAETAFVSPLLLQLGVPVYLMTLCWIASPMLGFFLVPILGSASDTCTSRLGRRRPFIIIYSLGITLGLFLVPYGKNIGELLGDENDMNTTISVLQNFTNITSSYDLYKQSTKVYVATSSHHIGKLHLPL